LNPFDAKRREQEKKLQAERHVKRVAAVKARRTKEGKKAKAERRTKFTVLEDEMKASFKKADDHWAKEEKLDAGIISESGSEDDE
jgi:hypothetical protein